MVSSRPFVEGAAGDLRLGWLEAFVVAKDQAFFARAGAALGRDADTIRDRVRDLEGWSARLLYRPDTVPIDWCPENADFSFELAVSVLDNFDAFFAAHGKGASQRKRSNKQRIYHNVRLRDLTAIAAVVEKLHIGSAAADVGINEHQVREALTKFERLLGSTLKTGSNLLTLTAAGKDYVELYAKTIKAFERLCALPHAEREAKRKEIQNEKLQNEGKYQGGELLRLARNIEFRASLAIRCAGGDPTPLPKGKLSLPDIERLRSNIRPLKAAVAKKYDVSERSMSAADLDLGFLKTSSAVCPEVRE